MGNEQDRFAFFGEVAHDLHQVDNLLRGQNSGRFIENQDFVFTVQHFQDFDALLHADGDVFDLGVGVDQEAVLLREGDDFLTGFFTLQESGLRGFDAENDVV